MRPRVGDYRVVSTHDEQPPYVLVCNDGTPVESVRDYLLELLASDCSPLTVKSYAFDLLNWFRLLAGVGVQWDQADRGHVRDWVLETKRKVNLQRRHSPDRPSAGTVNERTGKPSLRSGYAAATINHRLAVIVSFYEHARRLGRFPAVALVDKSGQGTERGNWRRSPLEPRRRGPRGTYRQKQERRIPRDIPDELYEELFAALHSDRDRAIVSLLVSSGARAAELLAMTEQDVDWGNQRVRLIGKGTREPNWVAASADALRWLARYLARERPPLEPAGPLWVTLRQPVRPLAYQALRAVVLRINEQLGANVTLHDFRQNGSHVTLGWQSIVGLLDRAAIHAGLRDVDGQPLIFRPHDLRRIFATDAVNGGLPVHIAAKLLGHLDLNTTQGYVAVYDDQVIRHVQGYVARRRATRPSEEYRDPTSAEWTEFEQHFRRRKMALGDCYRPYGTDCPHEHACVRCPMLRMDQNQLPRLVLIEQDTHRLLDEARKKGWEGEVLGLETTLHHIADKKAQAERLRAHAST